MTGVLFRKMVRDLRVIQSQVLTTGALIACGVGLLIATWSAWRSLKDARDSYYSEFRFADLFGDIKTGPLDLIPRLARIPGVEEVEPRVVVDGLIEDREAPTEEPALGRFISIPSGHQPILNRLYLRQGRLPKRSEETEVVLHEGYSKAHGIKPGTRLSVLIKGQREWVRVVGIALSPEFVVAVGPAVPFPDDRRYAVLWVPEPSLTRLAKMEGAFNNVAVRIAKGSSLSQVRSEMDGLLSPYGGTGVITRESQASARFVEDEIKEQKASAVISPAVFLGIAAFLVHIIASRLIALHRPQIAALKAMGYRHSEVSFHYLSLIFTMMLVGAIPGIALGRGLGALISGSYAQFFRFPNLDFSLNPQSVGIGMIAGLLPGLIGAWGSIRSVFRVSPAQAMRPPSPPEYHRTLFEALHLEKRFSIRQRMILRNLLMNPVRLILTLSGLSLATAVVVVSLCWTDILDFVLQTQFQRIQKEDLSVTLTHPVGRDGWQELSRRDGVLSVEGYRTIPIRIRHRNRSREVILMGWAEEAKMREQLDSQLRQIPLPDTGVLLSRFFQKNWGLKAGDAIEVETLEGEMKRRRVIVTGFSEDLMGLGASMKLRELQRVFNENANYNLFTILVDPARTQQVYVDLKATPAVASVVPKTVLFRGFKETIGRIVEIISAILVIFGLLIAGGIIFNSVQVSFSERSWELASLRVFGFSEARVFGMLISEVVFQVGITLLPGCLLGLGLTHLILSAMKTESFTFPLLILPRTYAIAMLTVIIALALSALFVRETLRRMKLADALKARE